MFYLLQNRGVPMGGDLALNLGGAEKISRTKFPK